MGNNEDAISCDFSNFFINFPTASTSLDSINSMQTILMLDDDYNVVLQGRIGQVRIFKKICKTSLHFVNVQGFYGEVYKGTLEYNGDKDIEPRQVAVKRLKTSAGLQDFEREIDIMQVITVVFIIVCIQ